MKLYIDDCINIYWNLILTETIFNNFIQFLFRYIYGLGCYEGLLNQTYTQLFFSTTTYKSLSV